MSELVVDRLDAVCTLALDRPARLNAFTASLHAELRMALDEAMQDDTVKVIVLKNTGHWILEENTRETTDALTKFL